MTSLFPAHSGVELCSICGRPLVPRIYNSAHVGEHNVTAWVCQYCDLIPEPRQHA